MSPSHSRPVRHRRTALPALCKVSPPPIRTFVTSLIIPGDSSCRLFPAKRARCAELLWKNIRFYDHHARGGSAPNSSGPDQHSSNPATPLKPDIRLGSPPQHLSSMLHPSETRKRQAPIPFGTNCEAVPDTSSPKNSMHSAKAFRTH